MCFEGKEQGVVIDNAQCFLQKDAAKEEMQHRRLQPVEGPELEGKAGEAKVWWVKRGQQEVGQITLWSVHSPVRMAIVRKARNNKCQQGCGEKGGLVHCWECKMVQSLWKTV